MLQILGGVLDLIGTKLTYWPATIIADGITYQQQLGTNHQWTTSDTLYTVTHTIRVSEILRH